jgi:AraC-like DNA-binding protein
MPMIRHRPTAPLDAYIDCFWWSRRSEPQTFCEHMLPSGGTQLIFALHETPILCLPRGSTQNSTWPSWSRGVLHGPQWNYFVAGPKPAGAVVGVSFKPGAAGILLDVSMTEITDRHIGLDDLWGHRGRVLHERLLAAKNTAQLFGLLERALLARMRRPFLLHPAVAHALTSAALLPAPLRVSHIQRRTGYSARHFIELFRDAVGLTPKHYYRVQRFTTVVQRLARDVQPKLSDIAALAGYSDQSHLTREFRDFAGVSPSRYRPSGPDRILHHRGPDLVAERRP